MAVIRRNKWQILLLMCIATAVGGGIWLMQAEASPARADELQSAEKSLNVATYQTVQQLRRELALTNQDMAAMGCSQQTAEAVLESLLTWYQYNKAALEQAQDAQRKARRELSAAMSRNHMGPRDQSLINRIPSLRNSAASADRARQALVAGIVPNVDRHLNISQRQVWNNARDNSHAPAQYRYLRMSTERQKQLVESRRAMVDDEADLSLSEQQALTAIQANMQLCMPGVLLAEESALPVPAELQEIYSTGTDVQLQSEK